MSSTLSQLCSRSFLAACFGHFFLFFAFFMLLPALPVYLTRELSADLSTTGFILALYTLAALFIRPFTGRLVDTIPRRKVYLVAYATFASLFAGYLFVDSLLGLGLLRLAHGLAFGILTIASGTIAIDSMPKHLIGTGIGLFGTTTAFAMSIAPMVGLEILDFWGFQELFISSLVSCAVGFLVAMQVKPPTQEIIKNAKAFSWHDLILPQGKMALLCMSCNTFLYGIFINYMAMLTTEKNLPQAPGLVYLLFSLGLVISRLFAGKMIDRGYLTRTITIGQCIVVLAFVPFLFTSSKAIFFVSGVFIGLGYGMIIPSFQALFNNLAPITKRGIASSTFLTSFDLGICISLFSTGIVADATSITTAYLFGVGVVAISLIFFYYKVAPHYQANKLQG